MAATAWIGKACTSETGPAVAPALDVSLSPTEARAGLISKTEELIGGIGARGEVGDYKIYNSKVAFVISRPESSRGYHPYGGIVVDADRIHEGAGRSAFGEVIVGLDMAVLRGDRIEIVSDGTGGGEARLRVVGRADVMPLFDALLSQILEPKRYDVEWKLDYVLAPGADTLRLDYSVKNLARETIDFGLPILAFLAGEGADPLIEGYGFDPPETGAGADYYAAVGEGVSYVYGLAGQRLALVIATSGVVVTGAGDGFSLRARETKTFSHTLVVGDGDLSRSQEAWRAAAGLPAGGRASGRLVDTAGAPVAGARVHVRRADPKPVERDYETTTRTNGDGTFQVTAPAGDYTLEVATDERLTTEARAVTIAAEAEVSGIELTVPARGTLRYRVKDGAGASLPVKMSIERTGDRVRALPERFGEPVQSHGLFQTIFAHAGEGELSLPPGAYRIFVSRGLEYEIAEVNVEVRAGEASTLDATLIRSVDTTGWMSTDTHIHAQRSPDSPDLYPMKVRAMVVENLELPVSTEHEAIGSFQPAIAELGLEPWMTGIVGSEITTMVFGHFNAYPLVPDPQKPGNGRIDWFNKSPGEMFAAIRANPGDPFIQVNHPRAAVIGGYFSAMGFDREQFTASRADEFSHDFDGIEVLNGCGNGTLDQAPIQDWFSFLNHGVKRFGVASTDNHKASSGNMGTPLTWVRMPTDDPKEARVDDFRAAFKAGRLVLSCGPFVSFTVASAEIGDTVAMNGSSITLDAVVRAPSWMSVTAVDVVVNGAVVRTVEVEPSTDPVRFQGAIEAPVTAGRDAWVAVSVRGAAHGVWARTRPSFAVTNPVFLDGDGDLTWTMPR